MRVPKLQTDYAHDRALAESVSMQANDRIDAGEDALIVVRDLIGQSARAYIGTPWLSWHPLLRVFMTYGDYHHLELWNANRGRGND